MRKDGAGGAVGGGRGSQPSDVERPTGNQRGVAMKVGKEQDFVNAGHRPPPHQAIGADLGRRRLYGRPTVSRLKIEQVIQNEAGSFNDSKGPSFSD